MIKTTLSLAVLILAGSYVTPASAAEVSVDQVGQQFSQKSLSAKTGDSIKFTNGDDVTHNISVAGPDGDDDMGLQKPGEAITAKLTKAGDYSVYCHIHPKMKMKVNVQ